MRRRDLRYRSLEKEILDDPSVPEHVRELCYRDLARTHRWLGTTRLILDRIVRDPIRVSKVLDIGCGHGSLLETLSQKLGVNVLGVDLLPPQGFGNISILRGDATWEPLPKADVAVSVMMVHHLSPVELCSLIRNVGRSCRRFLILDLVRHAIPIALFRIFIAPLVNRINVEDGIRSVERAYTPAELNRVVCDALEGTGAVFRHDVSPLFVRQTVDISYHSNPAC
jgi:SAM-dependent methyltransferase